MSTNNLDFVYYLVNEQLIGNDNLGEIEYLYQATITDLINPILVI